MDPFIGEIRILPFNFVPVNWAACNGALLPINSYQALFAVIGTMYGGDGQSTFAVPNLSGRVPIGAGTGVGLTPRVQGQTVGVTTVTLTAAQMPQHTHTLTASADAAVTTNPASVVPASGAPIYKVVTDPTQLQDMDAQLVGSTGSNGAHANMSPYMALQYCICVNGIFPSPH